MLSKSLDLRVGDRIFTASMTVKDGLGKGSKCYFEVLKRLGHVHVENT